MFRGIISGLLRNREREPDRHRCSFIRHALYADLILPFAVAVQAEEGV